VSSNRLCLRQSARKQTHRPTNGGTGRGNIIAHTDEIVLIVVMGFQHHVQHQGPPKRSVVSHSADAPLFQAQLTRRDFGPPYQVLEFISRQNIVLLRCCLAARPVCVCHDSFITQRRHAACFRLANFLCHVWTHGEGAKVLVLGIIVPQLSKVFFVHAIVGERLVLCHAKAHASSTTTSSVVVGGGLFLLDGGSSLHRHGRGRGGIVLFAALAPLVVVALHEHGAQVSAGHGHNHVLVVGWDCCLEWKYVTISNSKVGRQATTPKKMFVGPGLWTNTDFSLLLIGSDRCGTVTSPFSYYSIKDVFASATQKQKCAIDNQKALNRGQK
jgi:hypothetical protein